MTPKVNPFVIVIIIVLAVIGGYFMFDHFYVKEVDVQTYTETATVLRTYYKEGVSTLEDKTYYVELQTGKGDKVTAEGSVYYSACKNLSQVTLTYTVTTYSDDSKKIKVINIEKIGMHKK